jgi:hypothetical protein
VALEPFETELDDSEDDKSEDEGGRLL